MRFTLKQFFLQLYLRVFDESLFSRSASVAFYFSFALFPLLLFLVNIFGLVLTHAADLRLELFIYLQQIMPPTAFHLVQDTVTEVISKSSGGTLTFALLVTLWSGSTGFDSLRDALNGVYGVKETRAWWKTRVEVVLLTITIGGLIVLSLSVMFYGSRVFEWLLPASAPFLLKLLSWATVLVALLLAFALLYKFLPNYRTPGIKWITPGTIVAVVLWLLLSSCFRIYLQFFNNYANIYGSLGAMIILMFWLYLTALVILLGGVINAIFDQFSNAGQPEKSS